MVVWTRAVLRSAGVDAPALQRAVRGGELTRLGRDRYARGAPVPLERLVAPAGSGVALRGCSAARAWELPAPDGPLQAQVRRGCRRPALAAGVELRAVRRWEVVERDGLLVTDLTRTCADVAREHPLETAVCILDAALHRGVERSEIEAHLGRGSLGAGRARAALALADGRAESPLESRLRLALTLAGVPPDDVQHVVREENGRFVGRVDLWYPGLVVEADGFEHHSRREDYRRDRRKGVAYARLGLLVLRFSWEQVVGDPEEVAAAVRDALGARRRLDGTASALPERARRQSAAAPRRLRQPGRRQTGSGGAA